MAVAVRRLAGDEAAGEPGPVALPPEVLAAPVEGGHLFIERMDEWRKGLGWSHARFASHLGISRNYWWLLRTHQRDLTIGVAQRVLAERPEFQYYLTAAIRARSWRGRPPPESPVTDQEATPEGA